MSNDRIDHLPQWASTTYFTRILQRNFKDFLQIVAINVESAVPPGENFASIILRLNIDGLSKEGRLRKFNLILKSMPETKNLFEFLKFLGQFPKEKLIYDTLLPRMTRIYTNRRIKFGPDCVHTEETTQRITLLLEDLKASGFQSPMSNDGFDMAHMTSGLQKLAEFHAASVIYEQHFGPYEDEFHVGLVSERSRKFFEQRSGSMLEAFAVALKQWDLNRQDLEECQRKLPTSQEFVDQLIGLSRQDPTAFNVLNHGDFWRGNIMFRYNEHAAIEETVFLDFQLCKFGPPSYDLYLFIFTSAGRDIRTRRFNEFLAIYQTALTESLQELNYGGRIPTLTDVQELMKRDRFYAFFVAISYLPVILMPTGEDGKTNAEERLAGGTQADVARLKSMLNPIYAKEMNTLMPWLCREGFMDYLR